ncbi:LRR domain containing protein [Trema orientale]|uniref:LRR domain containing protein n=1 Tax=Trema orientale TaxID=63057 RepID=A0A2P5F3X7_TREOI|nr:LRR domain containing protein [Trema orientale]
MGLLTRLETLMIIDCEKLGEDENDKGNNIIPLSLRTLVLMKLPQLAALPRWLQGSSSTLNYLRIEDCNNLRTLPQWLTRIESLQKLTIRNCEALSFLQEDVLTYLRQNYTNEYSRLQIKIHGSPQLMRLIQGREEEHSTEYQGDTRAEEEQGTDHGAEIEPVDA